MSYDFIIPALQNNQNHYYAGPNNRSQELAENISSFCLCKSHYLDHYEYYIAIFPMFAMSRMFSKLCEKARLQKDEKRLAGVSFIRLIICVSIERQQSMKTRTAFRNPCILFAYILHFRCCNK